MLQRSNVGMSKHIQNVFREGKVTHMTNQSCLPIIKSNERGSGIIMRVPGYRYGDLNRLDYVPDHVAAKTFEEVRIAEIYPKRLGLDTTKQEPVQELMQKTFRKNDGYILSSIYEFTPAYYSHEHLYKDIIIDDRIANIGRTSFQHHCSLISSATLDLLCTSIVHIVCISHETSRPTSLPDFFLKYFKDRAETIPNINRVALLKRPQKTFQQKYVIQWSDVDSHFNHSEYIHATFNTMVSFCQKGQLLKLKNDLAIYRVKRLTCSYHKEGKPDEVMDIHIWQNDDNPFVLHGVMDNDGQLAFQCTYEFVELV